MFVLGQNFRKSTVKTVDMKKVLVEHTAMFDYFS